MEISRHEEAFSRVLPIWRQYTSTSIISCKLANLGLNDLKGSLVVKVHPVFFDVNTEARSLVQ